MSHAALTPKKHKSNSIAIVCYIKDSYVPCGFQVMHEEGRKEEGMNEERINEEMKKERKNEEVRKKGKKKGRKKK